MARKNPKTMKDEIDQTNSMIEKGQLKEPTSKSIDEESQDLHPSEFTEEVERETIAPLEKAGSEEISKETRDERFAKEHSIDESELRKSKKMKLEQSTDEPSDE